MVNQSTFLGQPIAASPPVGEKIPPSYFYFANVEHFGDGISVIGFWMKFGYGSIFAFILNLSMKNSSLITQLKCRS
jgi:hypothetical protein